MNDPSDHLLRTFAPVPYGNRVLDLNCGEGRRTAALVQLGFDVHACDAAETSVEVARNAVAEHLGPEEAGRRVTFAHAYALGYPDAFFDWIVAWDAFAGVHGHEALREVLAEARRVLRDGGWIYLTVPAVSAVPSPTAGESGYAGDSGMTLRFTPETLCAILEEAGFAEAQEPVLGDDQQILQAIFRRVDLNTPG